MTTVNVPGVSPAADPERAATSGSAIAFRNVSFAFDDHVILRNVSFEVPAGSLRFLLGVSGSGKSVLLKLILGLLKPDAGAILLNGRRIDDLPEYELLRLRATIGMVFQENALFDSLTVDENVGYRLYEESDMPLDDVRTRVAEVLGFIGLADYIDRHPPELSGGQRRRVALARALASRPALLLFDDPTTGLDPLTAISVDDEIVKLRDLEHVTVLVATHQMRDAFYVARHRAQRHAGAVEIVEDADPQLAEFMVLHEGGIVFEGDGAALLAAKDPFLKQLLLKTLPPW